MKRRILESSIDPQKIDPESYIQVYQQVLEQHSIRPRCKTKL